MMDRTNLLLFMSCSIIHLFISCLASNLLNITTDQSALTLFKSQFEHDHSNVLARNWSSDTPICSWIGVTCSFRHHRVAAINVSNMELSGIIPPELGNLSFLVSLDMTGNKLYGNLPKELSKLKRLKLISFSFNRFSGKIPSFFEAMPNLQQLYLRNCSFTGSIPPSLSNISKLEALDLAYNSLEGMIPVQIGNLGRLKILILGGNKFSGAIPDSVFNVSTLEILEFSYNSLSGNLPANMCRNLPSLTYFSVFSNQLCGQIPSTIGECSQLRTLKLQLNQFNGRIPKQIGNLSMLLYLYLGDNNFEGNLPMEICLQLPAIQKLSLGQNQLTGSIPRKLGNCSSLVELYLEENMFTGGIPSEIGNLLNLEILNLQINNLTYIPTAIFNISTLKHLSVYENQITGSLPSTMGKQLPSIREIFLAENYLNGPIPDFISNASSLTTLDLAVNKLSGRIPNSLAELNFLATLSLGANDLTSEASGMSFLTSLTNCRCLRNIWIDNNSLSGYLPDSIGNFSSSLEQLDLSNSRIKGRIPKEIGNITNLAFLLMRNNEFTGFIPFTIEGLKNLQVLSLLGNKLSGPIPDGLCHLPNLGELTLSKNKLYGPLPACLGNITSLRYLHLDSNELKSSISPTIGALKDLLVFNLFSNFLSGPLPLEIGNLKVLTSMDLSMNELSGSIPSTLGGLNNLITLSLAQNRLHGPILDSVSKMLGLEGLDLSRNNFTGSIPKSMEKLQHLHYLNLSLNKLTGEIPNGGPFAYFNYQSFISNAALCGPRRLQVPPCPSNHHHRSRQKAVLRASLISFVVVSTIVSLIISFFLIKCQRKNRVPSDRMDSFPAVMPERIRYHDLQRATNGFSEANLLGVGSFGSVYKGTFTDGTVAAIKVFNLHIEAAFRSFDTECEILRSLRHRNLAKVKSSCSNIDFRALVLEYMPNGSLENWLYSHDRPLNLSQRLSIMIDVASAIEYLHHGYAAPVVHCDLKPTNVLLDDAMIAHVSDFGIAKLVYAEDNVVLTGTLATFGYIAPEYGSEGLVSTKCDVYSFGIMLMETFTRKRPTDDLFTAGLSLRCWIYDLYSHSLGHVIDATLLNSEEESFDKNVECISLIMKLALDCSSELPGERINMKEARATLQKIKKLFFPHL
ncbi:Serine/threonine protein kinase [Handroanthus impetiginosus]|uniref:non-specific serine/threonine protein kinase n=1 Tax=Handroanthus impetiginosus TaxID=429701 RepID=A0A2G9HQ41_9LAMI|nr:Serine/threonine protein kinase [Handroanthus impetiginosus]